MAANTARTGQAMDRDMGFEEAEIRRKMGEIADWLKTQEDPSPAPKLQVVPHAHAPEAAAPQAAPAPDENSLDGILERRRANREAREQEAAANSGSLRELMGRFSGPIDSDDDGQPGALRAAVAEIVERQRRLDEDMDEPEAEQDAEFDALPQAASGMERAFERLAEQFEQRAAKSFDMLEASLADTIRRVQEAQDASVETAETAARQAVEDGLKIIQADTHVRIDEVSRGLEELRADSTEAERRTRDLLDAVRRTLEHVASRLPERAAVPAEPALPPAPAPAPVLPQEDATSRARSAALRAIEESLESDAAALTPAAAQSAPERRRFIAAARRSSQERTAPTAKYRAAAQPRVLAAEPRIAAPATTARVMRRTLLAGAAAAALLFGIYAGSSRFLDGVFSGAEVASTPAQSETAPTSAATAATGQSQTPDPYPAALLAPSVGNPQPLTPAPQIAAAPAEPVITGSIPEAAAPVDPLPTDIGGSRLRTRAVAGDAAAQYEVGMRFAEGRGVATDAEKAAAWFARAAQQGLAPAQFRLASLLEKGTGVTQDMQRARSLYEQAAAAGNVQAMHNLGVLYAEGGLGQPDMAVALVWFRKAAEHGAKDSQYNLGIFYARGLSVAPDLEESYLWFALAAAQGDKDAAAKRDQIGTKIGPEKVKAAKVRADTWQPKAAAVEANQVAAPLEGWDEAATGRASAGRKPI